MIKNAIIILFLCFLIGLGNLSSASPQETQKVMAFETTDDVSPESFLDLSQDDGNQFFKAMDDVYYVLSSIADYLEFNPEVFSDQIQKLSSEGLDFIDNVYENGHWANWKGSRPSMESTFQAIVTLNDSSFPSWFNKTEAQNVIDFLNSLKDIGGGFYPLENWDAPDITSTYRALLISHVLELQFGQFDRPLNITGVVDYIAGNFVEPVFITSGSGYSEITGGKPEVLASFYAIASFIILNTTDPNITNVIKFIGTLTSSNGGVAGYIGGLPRTGFTVRAIEYFVLVQNYFPELASEFPPNFLENAFNYVIGNKEPNSGFLSSSNDKTPNKESTFFAIGMITDLQRHSLLPRQIDLTGALEFMLYPPNPTFGFGDYPSDTANVIRTSQAILASKLLENDSWIDPNVKDFLWQSYTPEEGGFGLKPGTSPRVKYTYYSILALRALGEPLSNYGEIVTFIKNSEVETGGFGQKPGAKLAYMTHTYWAISVLKMLGNYETTEFNQTTLISFLSLLNDPNTGFFKNSVTSQPSIISTYRAIQILKWLQISINSTQILETLNLYKTPLGGYVNTLDKTVPTMEATYYAVSLQESLNASINWEEINQFVNSLKNNDGGYGLRPGFTSRVSSTFFALQLIGNKAKKLVNEGLMPDVFAPLIEQSFIPELDNYRKFSGTYVVKAKIIDPESSITNQAVEINWYSGSRNQSYLINGTSDDGEFVRFDIGPFNEKGLVEFRIIAKDLYGNTATTDWFYLVSIGIGEGNIQSKTNWIAIGIRSIPYLMALIGMTDVISKFKRFNTYSKEEIGIMYSPKSKEKWTDLEIFNTFFLILIMIGIATIGRLFIFEASFVLERSLFLFRFLLAIILILFTKYSLGLETYGLFAPSVLVISMIQIGPFWGSILFLNIFTLLYIVRVLISPYGFPVGFRIGIMMVFNITYLGVMELLGEIYRIPFLSSALFVPIIILPWITDRYVANIDQNDHLMAFSRLLASLVVTWMAYFLMSNDSLVRFVTLNPEIWVLLVAIIVFYGRGRKYTMIDIRRFERLFKGGEKPMSILIRNRNYIAKYNPSEVFPLINKFDMKLQFEKWKVPTPDLYAIVTDVREISEVMERIKTEEIFKKGFVIKPTQSLGGMGIIVVQARDDDGNLVVGGRKYAPEAIENEIQKIIQGEYLSTQTTSENDICIIEEKIEPDETLATISTGLPDVRIIIFKGIPVMAMARLPTVESEGKANLKQGAIGAGIDMETGKIFHAEWKQHPLKIHPDTKSPIVGLTIPKWKQILAIASLAQKSSGLGYAGIDIVLGKRDGAVEPYVLEINKRPGLEIQNINQSSLLNRIDLIENSTLDYREKSPLACATAGIKLGKVWKSKSWAEEFKLVFKEDFGNEIGE